MTKPKMLKFSSGNYVRQSICTNRGLSYAHARREKNKVVQLSVFGSCRESFIYNIFNDITNEEYTLSSRKLQCLARRVVSNNYDNGKKAFEEQSRVGLKILNILEDHYGWSLTKMFAVEPFEAIHIAGYPDRKVLMKLLVGPSKWRKSPHIVSLFLLLFRLPTKNMKFHKVENYEQLMKLCRQYAGLPEPESKDVVKAVSGDKRHVAETMKFWDPLITNLDKIFRGMTAKGIYNKSAYKYNYGNEGISKLCRFNCANTRINRRFVNVIKDTSIALPNKIKKKFGL